MNNRLVFLHLKLWPLLGDLLAARLALLLAPLHILGLCCCLLMTTQVVAGKANFDKNNDGYAVLYSSDADNRELASGQDFRVTELSSAAVIEQQYMEDKDYSPIIRVQPGHGWGAATATLAFEKLNIGFAEGYKSLIFKVKGTEKIYLKFTDNKDPESGTEIGFERELYVRAIDGKDDWYQVSLPLTNFKGLHGSSSFALHSGWGANTAFFITDIALSVKEAVVNDQRVQSIPEGSDIYIFSNVSRGNWQPYVGDPGWWNQPVSNENNVSQNKELEIKTTSYQASNDSVQAIWSGKGKLISQFYWQAPQPIDLTEMKNNGGVLALVLRIDKAPKGAVGMRMDCGYPCFGELNMSKLFRQVPEKQWFVIGVELSCFEKAGADLSQILSPFLLTTKKAFELSINQIAILQNLPKNQILPCSI